MSSIKMLFTSALVLLSTIANAAPLEKRQSDCDAETRVITVRGSYEVFHHSSLQAVYDAMLRKGANAILRGTPYPAALDYSNPSVYESSVAEGISSLNSLVTQAAQECPNQKIVLVGYSQGAQVVGNSLCGNTNAPGGSMIPGFAGDNVKAAVLFGDPAHIMSQTFVEGGATQNGMVPRYSNSDCAPYTSRMASFCHPNDPVCALGSDFNQHTDYMSLNADAAADFIMSKL